MGRCLPVFGIRRSFEHRGLGAFELNLSGLPTDPGQFATYVAELDDRQVGRLEEGLVAEFKKMYGDDKGASLDAQGVAKLRVYASQIEHVRSVRQERIQNAASAAAEEAAEKQAVALAELHQSVMSGGDGGGNGNGDGAGEGGDGSDGGDGEGVGEDVPEDASAPVQAAAFVRAFQELVRRTVPVEHVIRGDDLNAHVRSMSLSQASAFQPSSTRITAPPRQEAVLVSSADIPGHPQSSRIAGINDLVELMAQRARMLPVTHGSPNYVPVASLQRDHRYRLSLDSTPEEVDEVLVAATDVGALVAAGGWCAPSEISYDFFNVVCEDGMLDLPSVGVLNRGGFRYPTSATIADIFATTGALWSWTETQDIAAATGTGQSGTKPCARVACPGFNEVRSSCDGLCVTVGNLIDFAYPELVANHIRLVMAARAHRTNQLVIDQLAAASTAATITGPANSGYTGGILSAVELQAFDYRERFRMCEDAVLEVVLPRWAIGAMRTDLAQRMGLLAMDVSAGQIADWLNVRGVRAQFVADWQSGFTGQPFGSPAAIAVAWPGTVQFLIYAPGTWVRGQGLQLDLGVVRDSTLNATNDHTAAWMEDCYAVARVGHESRRITTQTLCVNGATGGSSAIACA